MPIISVKNHENDRRKEKSNIKDRREQSGERKIVVNTFWVRFFPIYR